MAGLVQARPGHPASLAPPKRDARVNPRCYGGSPAHAKSFVILRQRRDLVGIELVDIVSRATAAGATIRKLSLISSLWPAARDKRHRFARTQSTTTSKLRTHRFA
jgi:hypothetical protein